MLGKLVNEGLEGGVSLGEFPLITLNISEQQTSCGGGRGVPIAIDYLQVLVRRSCQTEHRRGGRFPPLSIYAIAGQDADRDERDRKQSQELLAIF